MGNGPKGPQNYPLKMGFSHKMTKSAQKWVESGGNDLKHVSNHFPHFPPIFEHFWSFYGKISFLGRILGSFGGFCPRDPSGTIKVQKILKKCMSDLKSSLDSEKRIKNRFKHIHGVLGWPPKSKGIFIVYYLGKCIKLNF